MLKQVALIGLSGLALVASPVSANETSAIAGTVASGVVSALVCGAAAYYANDEEVDPEAYDRTGWFVGVGANYAIETFDGDGTYSSVDDSFGINGRFGYRCHSRFSLEAEAEWVNGFDADFSGPSQNNVDVEPIVVTTNAKAYLLTGRTQPYLLVGLGLMRVKEDINSNTDHETRFAMRFGGGVDYYVTKNVVLGFDVDFVNAFRLDINYVLVGGGVQYRF